MHNFKHETAVDFFFFVIFRENKIKYFSQKECSMGENCFYLDFIDFNSFVSNGSACHLILHTLVSLMFL